MKARLPSCEQKLRKVRLWDKVSSMNLLLQGRKLAWNDVHQKTSYVMQTSKLNSFKVRTTPIIILWYNSPLVWAIRGFESVDHTCCSQLLFYLLILCLWLLTLYKLSLCLCIRYLWIRISMGSKPVLRVICFPLNASWAMLQLHPERLLRFMEVMCSLTDLLIPSAFGGPKSTAFRFSAPKCTLSGPQKAWWKWLGTAAIVFRGQQGVWPIDLNIYGFWFQQRIWE